MQGELQPEDIRGVVESEVMLVDLFGDVVFLEQIFIPALFLAQLCHSLTAPFCFSPIFLE